MHNVYVLVHTLPAVVVVAGVEPHGQKVAVEPTVPGCQIVDGVPEVFSSHHQSRVPEKPIEENVSLDRTRRCTHDRNRANDRLVYINQQST